MRYAVQVLKVIEIEVEADDNLQAEREARKAAGFGGSEIAILVQEADEADGGALADDDNAVNWQYAKDNFHTLDPDWVFSD